MLVWSKSKNLSKISSHTATVNCTWVCSKLPHASLPSSQPFFPALKQHASPILCWPQANDCCMQAHVPWCLVCSVPLQRFWTTGPDAYTRPRFLPAVIIRSHGSNEAVLKMTVHIPSICICDALNMPVGIRMWEGNLQGKDTALEAREDDKGWSGRAEKGWGSWVWNAVAQNGRSELGKARERKRQTAVKSGLD